MQTRLLVWAAVIAAVCGVNHAAFGQYGPAPGGYGPPMMGGGGYGPPGMGGGYGPQGMPPHAMAGYQGMGPEAGMAAAPPYGGPSCGDPSCSGGCGNGYGCGDGCGDCCQGWCHKINIFGEYLYLRARNAEVAYAVPFDGALPPPGSPVAQTGPVAVVDPDYASGFRFGAGFTLNECNAIVVTYSQYDVTTDDSVVIPGGTDLLRSLVTLDPINAAIDSLDATASLQIQWKTLDVDYKGLFAYCDDYKVNYLIGARWAQMEQNFDAAFTVLGTQAVHSDVEFDGGGLRLGLEGERYASNTGFFAYGKAITSLVGGEFRTRYTDQNLTDGTVFSDTSWRAGRIVSIYDLEVGLGWRNYCDNLRLSVGYTYSFWCNTVTNREWINAVQQNNFVDQSDNFDGMITFDGVTAKVEVLW